MVSGHFGLAAGVKSQVPSAPLWALMLATHWLDVVFVPLFLLGIETITPIDPANLNAYGGAVIHVEYTHSLVGALLLSVVVGGLAWLRWGRALSAADDSTVASARTTAPPRASFGIRVSTELESLGTPSGPRIHREYGRSMFSIPAHLECTFARRS